jgi:alpha-tubulin suppressor-like RCC1 family protein
MVPRARVRSVRRLLAGARTRLVLAGFISALAISGCLPTVPTASAPVTIVPASPSSPVLPPWKSSPAPALYAWGDNETGQLGDGSTTGSAVPVRVLLPRGVTPKAVSEGEGTSLALGSDGRVYAWGDNEFGQLGIGWFRGPRNCKPDACSTSPVAVRLPRGVSATAVSEGDGVSLAVGSDGEVYAWGDNELGQLGDGSTANSAVPVRVSLPGGRAIAVSAGINTSLVVSSDGSVYAWGDNADGQLGNGSTTGPQTCEGEACSRSPVAVSLPGGVAATEVSEGWQVSLALGSDGSAYSWGNNSYGQLGDGSRVSSATPVRASFPGGIPAATAVSAGYDASLAVGAKGYVLAWGTNTFGELGDGSTTDSLGPEGVSLPGGVAATAVSEGQDTSLALGSDGHIYAWGRNEDGQLGNGSTTGSPTPVQVPLPGGLAATAISEGAGTSLAIATEPTTAAAVSTTTSLTASPDPGTAGAPVTLTAAVSAANGTTLAGSVQFEAGGTDIGSPVTVNASGVATTTTTFATAGSQTLSAVFTPGGSAYQSSTGSCTETVNPAAGQAGGIPITVGVPQSGAFTVTVAPGTVTLAVSGQVATGMLQDVTVADTRNYFPGWSVSGQDSGFTGSGSAAGSAIAGDQLGWAPIAVGSLQGGATLGGTVAPASPGLGSTAATLASAAAGDGYGTNVLSADLTLAIPPAAAPGPYTGTLTVSYVEAAI